MQNGLIKAIEWIKLNQIHKKEFEKNICFLPITEKETYLFFKGDAGGFAKQASLTFVGNDDGTFRLYIDIDDVGVFLAMSRLKEVQEYLQMLQGKSISPEIDNIFH